MADNESSSGVGKVPPEALRLLSEPQPEVTGSPALATDPPTEGTSTLAEFVGSKSTVMPGFDDSVLTQEGQLTSDTRVSGTTAGDDEVTKSDNDNEGDNEDDDEGLMMPAPPPPQSGVDRTLTQVALILNQSQRKPEHHCQKAGRFESFKH